MILGILSLVAICFFPIAIVFAIIGIILSIIGLVKSKKAQRGNGCAVAGVVCNSITLFLLVGFFVLLAAGAEIAEDIFDEIFRIAPLYF